MFFNYIILSEDLVIMNFEFDGAYCSYYVVAPEAPDHGLHCLAFLVLNFVNLIKELKWIYILFYYRKTIF